MNFFTSRNPGFMDLIRERLGCCLLCTQRVQIPDDQTLIENQGDPGARDFIPEDSVVWLGHYRLIVATKRSGTFWPNARAEQVYLTGRAKRHWNGTEPRVKFIRGSAIDFEFSNAKTIRGSGPEEVISIPLTQLGQVVPQSPHLYLCIHEACLDIFFRYRPKDWLLDDILQIVPEPASIPEDETDESSDSQPEYTSPQMSSKQFDMLMTSYRTYAPLNLAGRSGANRHALAGTTVDNLSWQSMKLKMSFCDPMSDLHITRLRTLLGSQTLTDNATEKQNRHLDQWQRATSLEQSSHGLNSFASLPSEILMEISEYLTSREMSMLCYASNLIAWRCNQAGLWLRRLHADMPWLWDVTLSRVLEEQAAVSEKVSPTAIDWHSIYIDLREQSAHFSRKRTLPLVNRKRIWQHIQSMIDNTRKDSA